MNPPNAQAARPINGVNSMEDSPGARASPAEGEYLRRRRRRKLDLRTLHGTLRESARVYREIAEGRISLAEGEVRSRTLRRHSEILATLEQRDQIAAIQAQLAALQGAPVALPAFDASAAPDLHPQLADTEQAPQ